MGLLGDWPGARPDRDTSQQNQYADWIATYASEEFRLLAEWLRGYLDRLAPRPTRAERSALENAFLTSSRYEYLFWEMGYTKERWPV